MTDSPVDVDQLTLEEKCALTAGSDHWHVPGIPRLGIPTLKVTDGPVGARGANFTGGPPSAAFPCGTALAATFDPQLVEEVGRHLGEEVRAKGAHVLLAPTVNLHRGPLAGRNFECYSEDPYLTGRMAVAYIRGVQSTGVGACIKHFVANDSEFERFTISSEVPERALRELYLRPFEEAIAEVNPWAIMGAYNKLGGTWCCEHPELLTAILREEWGYDGLVISDWYATHTTVEAAHAGLDLEMPGPAQHLGPVLEKAVRSGEVDEAVVDEQVRRFLRLLHRTGALDGSAADAGAPEGSADTPERRDLARRAAAAAIVLLRNEPVDGAPVLPLLTRGRVAVLGPNAADTAILGGGSAWVAAYADTSVLEALQERLGEAGIEVRHEPGASGNRYPPLLDTRWCRTPGGERGFDIAFVPLGDPEGGEPLHHQRARSARFGWPDRAVGPLAPASWHARITTTLTPPATGTYRLQVAGTGRFRAVVDGNVVVDGWEGAAAPRRLEAAVDLGAGHDHDLRLDYDPAGERPGLELRLEPPRPSDAMERAVTAAREADVAVVVVGTNADTETEGRDRRSMDLPGDQDELVTRVAAANPRTVVVVNAGSPVTMPWVHDVAAVVQLWFPGMEGGRALADVLTGDTNPSGRLPTTFPKRFEDTPVVGNYPGEFGEVRYGEGLLMGYRWYDAHRIEPLFPFGHGLSYTTFSYGDVTARVAADGGELEVVVANTGDRAGAEVVQVYASPAEPTVQRPPQQLAGLARVELEAGQATTVRVELDRRAFSYWNPVERAWTVAPGEYRLRLGGSSRDVRAEVAVRT